MNVLNLQLLYVCVYMWTHYFSYFCVCVVLPTTPLAVRMRQEKGCIHVRPGDAVDRRRRGVTPERKR